MKTRTVKSCSYCRHQYLPRLLKCPNCGRKRHKVLTVKMPALQTFTVWTEQINQDMFTVRAHSVSEAIDKAKKEWRRENAAPEVNYVEDSTGKRVFDGEE